MCSGLSALSNVSKHARTSRERKRGQLMERLIKRYVRDDPHRAEAAITLAHAPSGTKSNRDDLLNSLPSLPWRVRNLRTRRLFARARSREAVDNHLLRPQLLVLRFRLPAPDRSALVGDPLRLVQ